MSWETVIGLEVHVQLACRSKIFSASSTAYGAPPNTQASLIDLGYPGVLPVLNKEAVRMAVVFGLACHADIAPVSVFARKNYFYPDLPKGYQISQLEQPIVGRGALTIELPDGSSRTIGITRAHLEEDAGKSLHDALPGLSGIDLNRAGTPLLEIVSEPELRTATEAVAYLRKLRTLVRYLGISDGNMQEGSFRCDANVSVRRSGAELGTRAEIKNLNSFRFIERAIDYEVERQIDLLESGRQVVQETRLYDESKDETRSMRSKEEANDYRYFPDPDLLPVELLPEWIEQQRATLPELPDARRTRFERDYSQPAETAALLASSREMADYFEDTVRMSGCDPRLAANWVTGELGAALNRERIELADSRIDARRLGGLLTRIEDGTISGKIAKDVFELMWSGDDKLDADSVIEQQGLRQISDAGELAALVDQVVTAHPEQVEQYRGGKTQLVGFFVGKVMQASGGKANPKQVNALLRERLAD